MFLFLGAKEELLGAFSILTGVGDRRSGRDLAPANAQLKITNPMGASRMTLRTGARKTKDDGDQVMGFLRYELRTTDLTAARNFYTDVFGSEFWVSGLGMVPLPEAAAARGAPAHWLGHLGVSDVAGTSDRFVRLGGSALRDPFGAVLALASQAEAAPELPVALRVHHSLDRERASAFYSEWFRPNDRQLFVTAPSPQVHSQWLFFFRCSDFERSVERVRALGGLVLDPVRTPDGDLVVACDDPQGAAFGLIRDGVDTGSTNVYTARRL